jgi:hypothetical protein
MASEKSGTPGKSPSRSRRAAGCCQRQVGNAHAQLTATGHATFISRIMAPRQQDQIARSRGWQSRRPGTNRPLSLNEAGTPGIKSKPRHASTKRLRQPGDPKKLFNLRPNVKEHATPLAGASVETGVEVHVTGDVADKAASGGCCASACCASLILCEGEENTEQFNRLNEHRQEAVAVAGLHQAGQQRPL